MGRVPSHTSEGWTYHNLIPSVAFGRDFSAQVAIRHAEVLSDVAVVPHQGEVTIANANQLSSKKRETYRQINIFPFEMNPPAARLALPEATN